MQIRNVAAAALLTLVGSSPAAAEVQLSLGNGRVTLVATDATVREILTEWARIGQTKIVNVERIPGGPVTLQLTDIPESEALDLLLKSVTGYMAAPRPLGVATLSRFDRILVLPTAAVARVPVAAPPPAFQPPDLMQRPEFDPNSAGGPSFPPRGPLFPTLQQQPGIAMPEVVEDQVNFPAQAMPPSPGEPSAAPFPGATAIGTPRPGMVPPPPPPQPGQGFIFGQQPPPPPPDN